VDTVNPLVKRWQRRVLKAVTLDRDPGDISTIEDEGSVEESPRSLGRDAVGSRRTLGSNQEDAHR